MSDYQQALALALSLAKGPGARRELVEAVVAGAVRAGGGPAWLAEMAGAEAAERLDQALLPYIDAPGAVVSGVTVEPR